MIPYLCTSESPRLSLILSASSLFLPSAASYILMATFQSNSASLDRYLTLSSSETILRTSALLDIPGCSRPLLLSFQIRLLIGNQLKDTSNGFDPDSELSFPCLSYPSLWPRQFALQSTQPCPWNCPSPSRMPPDSYQDPSITFTLNWSSPPSPWTSIPDTSGSPWRPFLRPICSSWYCWWRQRSWSEICPLSPPIFHPPSAWGPYSNFN